MSWGLDAALGWYTSGSIKGEHHPKNKKRCPLGGLGGGLICSNKGWESLKKGKEKAWADRGTEEWTFVVCLVWWWEIE